MAAKKRPNPRKNSNMTNYLRLSLFWAIIIVIALSLMAIFSPPEQLKEIPISNVVERANKGEISKIEGQGGELKITPKGQDKPTERSYIQGGIGTLLRDDTLTQEAKSTVIDDKAPSNTGDILWNVAIILIPTILIIGFFMFMMRQAQGQNNQAMGFGKSKAKLYGLDKEKVLFADIAGNEAAKQDLEEVVDPVSVRGKRRAAGSQPVYQPQVLPAQPYHQLAARRQRVHVSGACGLVNGLHPPVLRPQVHGPYLEGGAVAQRRGQKHHLNEAARLQDSLPEYSAWHLQVATHDVSPTKHMDTESPISALA